MPVGSIIPRGRDVAAESVTALRLMMREHEQAKQRRAEQEAARRAALEQADGSLALLVQVVNPSGSATGKPDVSVVFRIARLTGNRSEAVGTLAVQRYDASRLPVDFDVARGHPLFAAARASLAKWQRARTLGFADAEIGPLLVDACTRRGDTSAAATAARALLDANPRNEHAARTPASMHLAGQRSAEALQLLDSPPLESSADLETRFLVLHALYAGLSAPPRVQTPSPAGHDSRISRAPT
jgi:hypothetical protein